MQRGWLECTILTPPSHIFIKMLEVREDIVCWVYLVSCIETAFGRSTWGSFRDGKRQDEEYVCWWLVGWMRPQEGGMVGSYYWRLCVVFEFLQVCCVWKQGLIWIYITWPPGAPTQPPLFSSLTPTPRIRQRTPGALTKFPYIWESHSVCVCDERTYST